MQTLKVDLGERSYPIHIGEGLLDQPELLAPHIAGRQVAIISNETVAPLYLERLSRSLAAYSVISVVLPDGEAFKTWETLQLIFDGLLTARHDRRTTVVALGGGVIGDMAGFAAACYQRGVDLSKCRPRCCPRSIRRWAARPASTIRWARTWLARSISRMWC